MTRRGDDGVLVLDSDSQCAMCVIRSLGRKGVSVTAGSHGRPALGMLSRYSDATYVHPDPAGDREGFLDHLRDHLEGGDYFAVVPVEDHTTVLLSRHKRRLEATGTVVATEDWDTFELAFDKGSLFEAVADVDVPAPATYVPTSMAEVDRLAEEVDYPAVVKPRSKSYLTGEGYAVDLVTDENYVDSPAALRRTYPRVHRAGDRESSRLPFVQEYVPGRTTTTVGLADDGDLLAYFQEERLRTYPASGGNSALLAALDDPKMLEYARRVLGRLGWTGPAMVEFMRTPAGEYYLIEVNGRYWGSLPFAVDCGVDVPWLHYLQLRGVDPSPRIDFGGYRTDRLQRRLLYEDVKWLGEQVSRGNVGAVGPFLRAFGGSRHTFVDLDDPVPTVAAVVQAGALATRSLRGRVTRNGR